MSKSKGQIREPLNSRQRSILVTFYNQNPYPSANERQQLVQLTGRTMKQIQDWFSNRRRVDPKLLAGNTMTITTSQSPSLSTSSDTVPPIFYYTPAASMCPCCAYTQSVPTEAMYSYYYPITNQFH